FTKEENEVVDQTILTLFPGIKETGIFAMYLQVIESGQPLHAEVQYFDSARELWLDLSIAPLDANTVVGTFNDITYSKQAYKQIEEQKALLDNLLQNSTSAITVGQAIRDTNGRVVDERTLLVNDAAVKYTGVSKEVYLTKNASEVDPNYLQSTYFQQCIQTLETGEPFITQYHLESTGRWLEVSVSRMDKDRLIYIFTDVTSVKTAQLVIERSAAQLQAIINRTQSGILTAAPIKDEQGMICDFRFVIANKALAAYLGQEPEVLIGELGSNWFTGYKTNGLFELFCDTYENDKMNRFDFHYEDDGIDAWIDLMCTRFEDEILVTFTDYTPVKQLQLQLEASVEELRRSNQSLEEFAYAASHDLQEPLRKIHIFSERLQSDLSIQLNEHQRQMFDRMEAAVLRMRTLIEDLLAYSQIATQPGIFQPVDLNEVVHGVIQDLEATIIDTGATITIEDFCPVQGDRRQLRQLFHNLIGNALKYRKPDVAPNVTVTCCVVAVTDALHPSLLQHREGNYCLIEFKDNGIGFEQQYAEKIFQVFQRLHGRSEYQGTGVGLAIVKKVVSNHNGYITAEGEPDQGATFRVLLPV
ncbi:MAG TPA: ATP-binding protein, partial [Flavisolibacter sp.]|nr:ATP-binding protein [Flavisolibacter sp.]